MGQPVWPAAHIKIGQTRLGSKMCWPVVDRFKWVEPTRIDSSSSSFSPQALRQVTWHPTRENIIVLNVDGSCLGKPGLAGFGGLLMQGDGKWIQRFYGYLGIADNLKAELVAVFQDLRLAWSIGARQLLCFFLFSHNTNSHQAGELSESHVCFDPLQYSGAFTHILECSSRAHVVLGTRACRCVGKAGH